MPQQPPSAPKVSVVVPVHNPGRYLDDLVDSLLAQTMPAGDYEAVFVDDGSTDAAPARLDALAAEHPHVTVVHEEASGWSGRPRNVGIEAARGRYVQFADHDDRLRPEALERLYRYAEENGADVVVGKMAGLGRAVPRELFRKNRPDATLENAPLIDSLTPHKMFRREFLDDNGLRFPEGPRRLEDHVFVTEAYFLSRRTCVLSDYVTYVHTARDDAGNAGFRRLDPAGYFANLREALDVVERHTEPGPLRDRLFRRWLRVEMIERLRGARVLNAPADWRTDFFREVHAVVRERFGPGVARGLPALHRAVAAAVTDGDLDRVLALAHWEEGIGCRASAGPGRHADDGALRFTVGGELTSGRRPLTFVHEEDKGWPAGAGAGPTTAGSRPAGAGTDRLAPPAAAHTPEDLLDVTAQLRRAKIEVVARDAATGSERFLPTATETSREPGSAAATFRLRFTGAVEVPADGGPGGPGGPGDEQLLARFTCCGWSRQVALPVLLRRAADGRPALVAAERLNPLRRLAAGVRRRARRKLRRLRNR